MKSWWITNTSMLSRQNRRDCGGKTVTETDQMGRIKIT